jgi:anti-anti-sigma factor
MTTDSPRLTVATAGHTAVVRFGGTAVALDDHTVSLLQDQLLALAERPGPATLLLDFANVDYVSSLLLGTLVVLRRRLRACGRRLAVLNLAPAVYEVFELTKLTLLFDVRQAPGTGESGAGGGTPAGVLVVDNDAGVRDRLGVALRQQGFTVRQAASGQEAAELYQRHRDTIGLVLLGARMAALPGRETLAALLRLYPGVRCCFLADEAGPHGGAGLSELSPVRVFHKPLRADEIAAALREALGAPGPSA